MATWVRSVTGQLRLQIPDRLENWLQKGDKSMPTRFRLRSARGRDGLAMRRVKL